MSNNIFAEFLENCKVPSIGSDEWIQCIAESERDIARKLVDHSLPVNMVQVSGNWKVVFDGTEFTAGVFTDHSVAESFANNWNAKLIVR